MQICFESKVGSQQFWKHEKLFCILGTKSRRDLEKKSKFHDEESFSISNKDEKETCKGIFVLVWYKLSLISNLRKFQKLILFPKPIYTSVTNTSKQK